MVECLWGEQVVALKDGTGMDGTSYWIVNGVVDNDPMTRPGIDTPEALMQRAGGVFIQSSREGTIIRWAMFASNWASLYSVAESIQTMPGPYTFEFFLAGWFTQTVRDPQHAALRLQDLIMKSDIHLRQKTHVRTMDPSTFGAVSRLVGDTIADRRASPERAVDCVFDSHTGQFLVERVGDQSTVAKFYGTTSPTSFPCQIGNAYDHIVSRAYKRVMTEGELLYGHVLAVFPTKTVAEQWLGYQRVVLPHMFPDGRKGVSVVTEMSDVDINLI